MGVAENSTLPAVLTYRARSNYNHSKEEGLSINPKIDFPSF